MLQQTYTLLYTNFFHTAKIFWGDCASRDDVNNLTLRKIDSWSVVDEIKNPILILFVANLKSVMHFDGYRANACV